MKKSSVKNKKPVKPNQKISAYFNKITSSSASKNAHTSPLETSRLPTTKRINQIKTSGNGSSEVICLNDSDEDFIETTPTTKCAKSLTSVISTRSYNSISRSLNSPRNNGSKATDTVLEVISRLESPKNGISKIEASDKVLETITNLPNCSTALDASYLTPNSRKRSRENTPSPDFIPCSLNAKELAKFSCITKFPPRKKTAKASDQIQVTNVSSLSQPEFEHLHSPSKNNQDKKLLSPFTSPSLRCKPVEELIDEKLCFSPTKRSFDANQRTTPDKLKTTPSKKQSSGKKTPGKGRRTSPTKLFGRSPKSLHKFNVEVIENFVKITPSKSDRKNQPSTSYASPNVSTRSLKIQMENERTPPKSPQESRPSLQVSKVKIKLDFGGNTEHVEAEGSGAVEEDKSSKAVNSLQAEGLGFACDMGSMLNDSWEGDMSAVDGLEHTLDLTESQHCKIAKIERSFQEITLIVRSTKDGTTALCSVAGFWFEAKLELNDTIHISAVYDETKLTWCVNNNCGLIVFEPDFLVSTTSVVGALFCRRRSVLTEKFRGFEPSNRAMIVGVLVHKLLQEVLKKDVAIFSEIEVVVKKLMLEKDTVCMCYESGLEFEDILKELMEFVPRIVSFMNCYVVQHKNGSLAQKINKEDWRGRIDSIQDIEENIWCPELGIKGKVDVSIQSKVSVMPLELKTGRATVSLEHRGQVILYIMMMAKFGYRVPSGLLLYLREGVLREIPVTAKEKRDLIILRNELTYYLTRKPRIAVLNGSAKAQKKVNGTVYNGYLDSRQESMLHSELPEPINHHSACSKCPYNTICCAYLKFEDVSLANNPLKNVQEEVLAHVELPHLQYFVEWSSLLALEASCSVGNKQLHEIYRVPPERREKNGQCIINVQVKEVTPECGGLFKHTFKKNRSYDGAINLLSSGIGIGNYVVVSTDARPAVAAGFVTYMDYQNITIALDRDLNKRYSKCKFHLDTYNSSIAQTFNMANLALLLEASDQAEKLRKIIIDKKPPMFVNKLPKIVAIKGTPILRTLNKMQQKAILKALSANDYLLIKGMPGTGKTATIVALIRLLVDINKTVLITSHTHSAVDNVCVRLQACGVSVLRLGSESKINPKLHSCAEHVVTQRCKTPEQLEQVYNGAKVLAVTCLGSGHPVINKRQLDVCIVDESTQVLQCSVFKALYTASKFILIGDPDQLPPIVRSREAVKRGLSESLFERLDSPVATVMLKLNYRMNQPITDMANGLTYEGQLLTANVDVANATLCLPELQKFEVTYKDSPWIRQVLDQSLAASVRVLDTGPVCNRLPLFEEQHGNTDAPTEEIIKCTNPFEVAIVNALVDALLEGGISSSMIGVIAPYRAQVSKISQALKGKEVEVSTVDQFQGRDKEVVIYSCTRSCSTKKSHSESEFEILEDKRRLTVAITRAKHKFILIGDLASIRQYSPFAKLLSCLEESCFLKLEDGSLGFSWNTLKSSSNLRTSNSGVN